MAADNITVDTISGDPVVAADLVGGAHVQRIKLIQGADGVNDGDVSKANPFPVVETVKSTFSSERDQYTSDQTDTQIIAAPASGQIVVTSIQISADHGNADNVDILIGFHATTTPTGTEVIVSIPTLAPGEKYILTGVSFRGAVDADLRITSVEASSLDTTTFDVVTGYYTE